MSAWYDLHPCDYAKGLEFSASRSEEIAERKETEGKPWSSSDADRFRRQARRLRAMARLCVRSNAKRAGDVDFRRLSDPTLALDEEEIIIAEIEAS